MNVGQQRHGAGKETSFVMWSAVITAPKNQLKHAVIDGWKVEETLSGLILLPEGNLVVDSGVNTSLNRLFATAGTPGAIVRCGVDNGASNPVAGTDSSGANTKTLLTFDSTPAATTTKVITASRTFSNSNVNFAMRRLFLSRHTADITNATTADAAGTMHSCTNTFTIDFTTLTTWTAVFAATVTGIGA